MLSFIQHIKEWTASHGAELAGGGSGSTFGVIGMSSGFIEVRNDMHAILLAFLTGAAGYLGALLLKAFIKKCFPSLLKGHDKEQPGG